MLAYSFVQFSALCSFQNKTCIYFQPEEEKPDPTKELEETVTHSDLFSQLTPEDVREVIESVTKEMLGSLQVR